MTDLLGPPLSARPAASYTISWDIILRHSPDRLFDALRSISTGKMAPTRTKRQADAAHYLLDTLGPRLCLIERQSQPFGHQGDIDILDARQALDRTAHLGGA